MDESNPFGSKAESPFLSVLWAGLCHLNGALQEIESAEVEKLKRDSESRGQKYLGSVGSSFGSGANDTLITNYFIWYANSAANFLGLLDKAYSLGGAYKAEFPEMLKWRNKVAAHTAYAAPKSDDSRNSQAVSLMMHPEWHGDRYFVGKFQIISLVEDDASHGDWGWSLTAEHERILNLVKTLSG